MTAQEYYKGLLLKSAISALSIQESNGSFPAGHNNKWNDDDTPVRVTSHFIIQLVFAYRETRDSIFLEAAKKSGNYLISQEVRPFGKTFICRNTSKKNKCNGLIGQAWAIEALVHLSKVTSDEKYLTCARDVYRLHPFDSSYGLFCPVEIDGRTLPPAKTLNHQLIFAASGLGLVSLGCNEFLNDLKGFYNKLTENISLTSDGLINHHVRYGKNKFERLLFDVVRYYHRIKLFERSLGYHSFNLFGLSVAHWFLSGFEYWEKDSFKALSLKVSKFSHSKKYINNIVKNDYALQYRLTGQELLFFEREFFKSTDFHEAEKLVQTQFSRHWDDNKKLMCHNTGDANTLSSRLYEMTYLYMRN